MPGATTDSAGLPLKAASGVEYRQSHGFVDASSYEGIAFWARRGPEGQDHSFLIITDKFTSGRLARENADVLQASARVPQCLSKRSAVLAGQSQLVDAHVPLLRSQGRSAAHCSDRFTARSLVSAVWCQRLLEPRDLQRSRLRRQSVRPYTFPAADETGEYCWNLNDPPPPSRDDRCQDGWQATVQLSTDWKFYAVPFSELRQGGFGKRAPYLDLKSLDTVAFGSTMGWATPILTMSHSIVARSRALRRLAASLLATCVRRCRSWLEPTTPMRRSPTRPQTPESRPATPTGYIPGNRRGMAVGLSPFAPETGALPGGMTVPFSAPSPSDDWNFKFWGFMSASLRASRGTRDVATPDQFTTTLHSFPRVVDAYGLFSGTNAPQGSWVDLTSSTATRQVTSHVKLSTWKPTRGLGLDSARQPELLPRGVPLVQIPHRQAEHEGQRWAPSATSTVGSANTTWANTTPRSSAAPSASVRRLTAQYHSRRQATRSSWRTASWGASARCPSGRRRSSASTVVQSLDPLELRPPRARRSRQARAGAARASGFTTSPTGRRTSATRSTTRVRRSSTKRNRPDPRMDVYGADFRMIDNHLGNFAVAASYADAHYATLLTGINFFGSFNGEQMTKRFFGPHGGGTAKMLVTGAEYNLGWSRLLGYPETFGGEGPELITSVFADYASVESPIPTSTVARCTSSARRSPTGSSPGSRLGRASITCAQLQGQGRELQRHQPQADLPERLEQPRAGDARATRAGSTARTRTPSSPTTSRAASSTTRCTH